MPSNAGLQRAQRRVVGIIQWSVVVLAASLYRRHWHGRGDDVNVIGYPGHHHTSHIGSVSAVRSWHLRRTKRDAVRYL
jgi:hypothetical protein